MTNLEARRKALKSMIRQQPKAKKGAKPTTAAITDESSYQGGNAPRGTIA